MENMNSDNMYNQNVPPTPTPRKAVASLILGICSVVFGCAGPVGMVCAIIDLIVSNRLKEEVMEIPQIGKVGKVLGVIGLVISILGLIFWIVNIVILILYGEWEVTYY